MSWIKSYRVSFAPLRQQLTDCRSKLKTPANYLTISLSAYKLPVSHVWLPLQIHILQLRLYEEGRPRGNGSVEADMKANKVTMKPSAYIAVTWSQHPMCLHESIGQNKKVLNPRFRTITVPRAPPPTLNIFPDNNWDFFFLLAMLTSLHSWFRLASETGSNCGTSPSLLANSLTQPCHHGVWMIWHTQYKHAYNFFRISTYPHSYWECCIHFHQGHTLVLTLSLLFTLL